MKFHYKAKNAEQQYFEGPELPCERAGGIEQVVVSLECGETENLIVFAVAREPSARFKAVFHSSSESTEKG